MNCASPEATVLRGGGRRRYPRPALRWRRVRRIRTMRTRPTSAKGVPLAPRGGEREAIRVRDESFRAPRIYALDRGRPEPGPRIEGAALEVVRLRATIELPGGSAAAGVARIRPAPVPFLRIDLSSSVRRLAPRRARGFPAIWIEPHAPLRDRLRDAGLSLHDASFALGHALRALCALHAAPCPDGCFAALPVGRLALVRPGAVFLAGPSPEWAERLLRGIATLLRDGLELLESCGCRNGCASCVGIHDFDRAGGRHRSDRPLATPQARRHLPSKRAARRLLRGLVGAPIPGPRSLTPWGGIDTISPSFPSTKDFRIVRIPSG